MRKEHERLEQVLADYLDRNLYTIQNGLYPSERYTDKSSQTKGLDISTPMGEVDEKMAVSYINKEIDTFSLELVTLNRKRSEMKGWFVNEELENTHYILGWIKAKKNSNITLEDIIQVEVVIVSKDKLKAYINKYFDLSRIDYAHTLFKNGVSVKDVNNKMGLNMDKHKFILYYSPKLTEKPMNLILKKELYIKLADKHLCV